MLTTPHCKNISSYKPFKKVLDMGLILWYYLSNGTGTYTWTERSLYRAGSLSTVARELLRYKSDLVGVGEVRWDKRGTLRAGDSIFYVEETKIIN